MGQVAFKEKSNVITAIPHLLEISGCIITIDAIENSLHWFLNMYFREDESIARKEFSVESFNALKHLAYNVLKSDTSFKGSFPNKH